MLGDTWIPAPTSAIYMRCALAWFFPSSGLLDDGMYTLGAASRMVTWCPLMPRVKAAAIPPMPVWSKFTSFFFFFFFSLSLI